MFDIAFTGVPTHNNGGWHYAAGLISLGEFAEGFRANIGPWGPFEYEHHWLEAARHLVRGGLRTAFLESYYGRGRQHHSWWAAWRDGERIYLQNRFGGSALVLDPARPWASVGARTSTTEKGAKISEWEVTRRDLREFVERRARLSRVVNRL